MTTMELLPYRLPAHRGLVPGQASSAPVPPDLAASLAAACGLPACTAVELGIGGGETHFFRVDGDGEALFLLKAVHPDMLPSQIAANGIASHVHNAGLRVSCLAAGFPASVAMDGRTWALLGYPFIRGRHGAGSREDLRALGRTLGRLHLAMAGADDECASHARSAWMGTARTILTVWDRMASGACAGPLKKDIRAVFKGTESWIPQMGAQMIHGDLNPGNVLFSDDGVVFLDFEDAVRTWLPPEIDLAFALERFVLVVHDDDDAAECAARALMEGWRAGGGQGGRIPPLCVLLDWLSYKALCLLSALQDAGRPMPEAEWEKFLHLLDLHRARQALLGRLDAILHA